MNRQLAISIALLTTTGCSSFDDDVFPHVVNASVTATPAAPTALAAVDLTLEIVAGSRAEHEVELGEVRLEQPADGLIVQALHLAFPGDPTLTFHPGNTKTVGLVNTGTTNADLAALCGQALDVSVFLGYPDTSELTGGGAPVTVVCD